MALPYSGVAVAALLLTAGCSPAEDDVEKDPAAARTTDGPLVTLTEPGGQAISPPPARQLSEEGTWAATFGFPVCTEGPTVTLERVRLEGSPSPSSSATLRSVEGGEEWSLPLASALGSPPGWDEPYADPSGITGSYAAAAGAEVIQPCPGTGSTDRSGGEAYQELLVTLRTAPAGTAAPSFRVDYSADGREHSVEVPWEMVLCGTRSDPETCS